MTWILVVYAYSCINPGGIDPGIIPGNCGNRQRTEIIMPSQQICEQVRDENKYASAQCWARVDPPSITGPGNFTIMPNLIK